MAMLETANQTASKPSANLVKHTKVRVTDTRKGWPGLRMIMKYAVRVGGAHNHIFSLANCILVKDNHIKIAGSITNAIETLRATAQHTFKIEVECETLEMVEEALACGVEIIMFDNMDLDEMKAGLKLVNGRAMTEASGGINEQTERVIANLRAVLSAAGLSFANVVKTTVFLKNMSDFAAMNEVYGRAFAGEGGVAPARSTVQVAGLPKDALVEIECIAKA